MKYITSFTLAAFIVAGCSSDNSTDTKTTTKDTSKPSIETACKSKMAFSRSQKLSHDDEDFRVLGKSFFRVPWVEAPSATTARDGLGPLFSANTCMHCHPGNGAGVAIDENGAMKRSLLMRLSIPASQNLNNNLLLKKGFIPETTYGGQLSITGT